MTPPTILRDQTGKINIIPAEAESEIYYTLDGSIPNKESKKYEGPFLTEGKITVDAIAYEPSSGKSSTATHEEYDLPREDWKIIGIDDEKAYAILDGNQYTAWHQNRSKKFPVDLVIDLGKELKVSGFRYFPDQALWGPGIITNYNFFVSSDNKSWKLVDQGEFANIKNNPLWQTIMFKTEKARYIKFRALGNTEGNNNIGYAEVDVVTN